MYRNQPKSPCDGSDGSAPSAAWLFAQAILGKPIPRIASPETKARAEREELERLAEFSTRHADELRRLQASEAEARHDREVLEWAAHRGRRVFEGTWPCPTEKENDDIRRIRVGAGGMPGFVP